MGVTARAVCAALLVVIAARADAFWTAGPEIGQRTTRDKIYSKEQAKQGAAQYAKACARCHDPAKVEPGKKPGPPLIGDAFQAQWKDRTLGELLTLIQLTMPNDGSAVLSPEETADVVAYMLSVNGYPEGAAPLKAGGATDEIKIVPVK
jgi:mono/diheme cytochrome c family protein